MKLRMVPARQGAQWVKMGMRTFFKQPLALSGLFFMFMAAMSVLSMVPFIGSALALAVMPAATLGLMAASQQATEGKFPMPLVLFSAFRAGRPQMQAMLLLGALYAAAVLLISALVTLADGGELAKSEQALGSMNELMKQPPEVQQAAVSDMLSHLMRLLSYSLLMLVLYTPVSLAFWHAPALTHWNGVSAVKSLFFSFVACIRNIKAIAVFNLYWFAVYSAVTLPLSLLGMLLGSPELAMALVAPASLVLLAIYFISVYFSFLDSFAEEPSEPAQSIEFQEQP